LGAPINVSGVVSTSVTVGNVAVTGGSIQTITTGSFSATVDNTAVIFAIATGNARELTNNILLSGVSGLLASNLTDPAYVTGQVGITTSLLAVSGYSTLTNPLLAISGNSTITNTAPIPFSGVTQANITNAILTTQVTGFNTGLVVVTEPVTKTVVSNSIPSGAAPWTSMTAMQTGQLGANPSRVMLFIQTIHTGIPTYVALNNTIASTGNFNLILNPSTVQGWGGTSFGDSHYRGPVQISGGAFISWEL
jgi:hypothetical protein